MKNRPVYGWIIVITLSLSVILFGGIPWLGNRLVSMAAFYPQPGIQVDPRSFPVPIETVFLRTQDGVRISAFYLPRPDARHAILFLHGNAGNASHRLVDAVRLWESGVNVLLLDYRGYGLSEGNPSEQGVYLDGEAGLDYLVGELGFDYTDVVLFGRSIGSTVAVHIAQEKRLGGLILVSPLTSGREMARDQKMGWVSPLIGNPFDSIGKIANVSSPVMVIHGERDRVIPVQMGEEIYARAPAPTGFHLIPDAGHNDLIDHSSERFFGYVSAFLAGLADSGAGN